MGAALQSMLNYILQVFSIVTIYMYGCLILEHFYVTPYTLSKGNHTTVFITSEQRHIHSFLFNFSCLSNSSRDKPTCFIQNFFFFKEPFPLSVPVLWHSSTCSCDSQKEESERRKTHEIFHFRPHQMTKRKLHLWRSSSSAQHPGWAHSFRLTC